MSDGCVTYPGSPGTPAVPSSSTTLVDLGWDAGGDSILELDGDLHLVFPMPNQVIGAYGGLKGSRVGVGIPEQLPFSFLFERGGSHDFYAIAEYGAALTTLVQRDSALDEVFEIRRIGNTVTYLVNNVTVYRSKQISYGPLITSASLFSPGDQIGTIIAWEALVGAAIDGVAAVTLRRPGVYASDVASTGLVGIYRPSAALVGSGDAIRVDLRRPSAYGSDTDSFAAVALDRPGVSASAAPAPVVNIGVVALYRPFVSATGGTIVTGSAQITLRRPGVYASNSPSVGIVNLRRPGVLGTDFNPSSGVIFFAAQSPGYVSMFSPEDATHKFLFDYMAFEADSPSAQAVLALLDSIAFGDDISQQVNLHVLIAAQLAFGDVSFGAPAGILSDQVRFSDSNISLAMRLAALLDSFSVAAALTSSAAIFAFLADSFELDSSLSVKQQILQALQDGFEFGMTLYTGADTYTAWVMTTQTRAMSSYSNYAFNSYAPFAGRLFAAKDDGVYVLEGATDAGQAINASVRTGLIDFGSRQLKRVQRAYLGYTADGTLALRVTTTSPQGKKVGYTYRMVKAPSAGAPRETRIIIGKGLQSVYWAFELDNSLDGGDFELHDVIVLPIILSRKVR